MTSFYFATLCADLSDCDDPIVDNLHHFPPFVEVKMLLPIAKVFCGFVKLGSSLHRPHHIELVIAAAGQFLFSFQGFSPAFNS